MSTLGDVQVGDVGTLYKARILDAGEDFDPADATTSILIWKAPDLTVIERDATITAEDSDDDTIDDQWFLTYTVVEDDIADGLHLVPGKYSWQGYVEFPDGSHYHTNVETYLVKGNLN